MRWLAVVGGAVLMTAAASSERSWAAEPVRGGVLVYGVDAEPPNYDCQGTTTFAALHTMSPHYSGLMKYDQDKYPGFKPDLAESWEVSPDQLTYTFHLRANVKFHDGSSFSSDDVKATLDRIRNPPQGVISVRKARYEDISTIETPDPSDGW